ncbi:MAG: hypothetical protein KF850_31730 [Labilithrix sp.]|nr:hypothetical protein [Labilithrix sp.]MBX3216649.1 hypothetical protein [Labilithrix sp.]
MRSPPLAALVSVVALTALALATAACDQLNRPFGSPSSSSSSGSTASADAGDDSDDASVVAPAITAEPGDIQL